MSKQLISLTSKDGSDKPNTLTFNDTGSNREYYLETRWDDTEDGKPRYYAVLLDLRQLCELAEVINTEIIYAARAEARRIREQQQQ